MVQNGLMSSDIDLGTLAHQTTHFTGAELEALVRSAQSYSLMEHVHGLDQIDETRLSITAQHFEAALDEIQPAFGIPREKWANYQRGGILNFGRDSNPQRWVEWCDKPSVAPMKSLLFYGPHGVGCTAVAAYVAQHTSLPCVKWLSPQRFLHLGEMAKARLLREAFESAFMCEHSLIVIDDIEEWFDYLSLQRFSSYLMKQLLTLCRQTPPEGKFCKLICTSHLWGESGVLEEMGWKDVFTEVHELPLVISTTWDESLPIDFSQLSLPIPIKTAINSQ
jgi:vesicle-fusing ATPase